MRSLVGEPVLPRPWEIAAFLEDYFLGLDGSETRFSTSLCSSVVVVGSVVGGRGPCHAVEDFEVEFFVG